MDAPAADRASRNAALVLAFALPADTLLYLLLPLYHFAFGVTLGEAGLLLAANRLVRIVGYGWVARIYAGQGPRNACLLAAGGAVLAAAGYAVLSGVWALLIARLIWGLSFAVLNIATQALPTSEPGAAARRSGRARSIIAVGPMLGLLGGAVLAQTVGPRSAFVVLAVAAVAGLFFARRLPSERDGWTGHVPGAPRFALPSRLDLWSFTQGLTVDGLFVVGLSVLAAAAVPGNAALAAGAALALRYAAETALSPVGGAVAERLGAERLLVWLSLAAAGSLALVGMDLLWIGALLVVVLRGLLQPLPAPVAAALNPGTARVPALAKLATWRDLGAGVGPLLAGLLLPLIAPSLLYGGAALLMALSAVSLASQHRIERM